MRHIVEYAAVRLLVGVVGALPRPLAHAAGAGIGLAAAALLPRLRRVGERNLQFAFPDLSPEQRRRILLQLYLHLGEQLAEFCRMRRYTAENTRELIRYEGLEHYLEAKARGRGVLVVTGHLGFWELSSFYHSLMGHPMSMVIRRLDNPLVDRFVNGIRCLHGNVVLHKNDFARGLLAAMRRGETVGVLMDTNMTPPQGVFVDFFGRLACTASGVARVALKTGAAVLPGFLLWRPGERRYVLEFGPPFDLIRTGDEERDILANTQQFASATERVIRKYPEQWLWVHRRWKTRPPGELPIYSQTKA